MTKSPLDDIDVSKWNSRYPQIQPIIDQRSSAFGAIGWCWKIIFSEWVKAIWMGPEKV